MESVQWVETGQVGELWRKGYVENMRRMMSWNVHRNDLTKASRIDVQEWLLPTCSSGDVDD